MTQWALARPGKGLGQYPKFPSEFVAEKGPKWRNPPAPGPIHALSLSKQLPHAHTLREFDETRSDQWRGVWGTEEEQAALRYRCALPVTVVERIPDQPFTLHAKEGERGSQETADAQTGADDRHYWGKDHAPKTITTTHQGWLQGTLSDDQLCQVISEYATFHLRAKWPRLGDDIPDVVQLSTLKLFHKLKASPNYRLTQTLIIVRAGRDAEEWREHVHFDYETKPPTESEDGSETVVDEDEVIPTRDAADGAPSRPDHDRRLLRKLITQLPEHQRVVIEMRWAGSDDKAIATALGCSPRYVRTLGQKAEAAMKGAIAE